MARDEPRINPYRPLVSNYGAQNLSLARALPPEAWGAWVIEKRSLRHEPISVRRGRRWCVCHLDDAAEAKLDFLDRYLYQCLLPKDIMEEIDDETGAVLWRADMNKYRPWLLNKILRHMQDIAQGGAGEKLSFPSCLPTITRALYFFHKHVAGPEANIERYRTIRALLEKTKDFSYFPLAKADREEAARVLGPGEAKKVAQLDDGTEVLLLKTRLAAQLYGSSRWCTAREGEGNEFAFYAEDLLLVLNPFGARWQISFTRKDWRDDAGAELASFVETKPGLDRALQPFLMTRLGGPVEDRDEAGPIVQLAGQVPLWAAEVGVKMGDLFLAAARGGHLAWLAAYAWQASYRTDWSAALAAVGARGLLQLAETPVLVLPAQELEADPRHLAAVQQALLKELFVGLARSKAVVDALAPEIVSLTETMRRSPSSDLSKAWGRFVKDAYPYAALPPETTTRAFKQWYIRQGLT
jgi:hypothetical protein